MAESDAGLNGHAVAANGPPRSLRDALRAVAEARKTSTASDASVAASESPSEEDYDDFSPSAEAMVLRQRRPQQTQLRHELQADELKKSKGEAEAEAEGAEVADLATGADQSKTRVGISTSVSGVPPSATSSRRQRDGRKLSATVIFEEKGAPGGRPLSLSMAGLASQESGKIHGNGSVNGNGNGNARLRDGRSFVVSIDDPKLAEILRSDLETMCEVIEERRAEKAAQDGSNNADGSGTTTPEVADKKKRRRQRGRFRDLVFTRKFSTFDRQNEAAANSPFHGFFTLFWIGVFLFIVKIAADNWRKTGSPLGTNEMMNIMFHRDVVVLLASDGALCALTGVSWLLQRLVLAGWIDWDRSGWVLQNVWQTLFTAGFIGWTQLRDWPWSHTVFFVLHGLVMLMKQHSYAFYNGYLSTLYKRRATLRTRLHQLEAIQPSAPTTPAALADDGFHELLGRNPTKDEKKEAEAAAATQTAAEAAADLLVNALPATAAKATETVFRVVAALEAGQPLDADQVRVFRRVLRWEIDGLTDELRGKAPRPDQAYPHNLTAANHYEYIVLPTVVYELEYPRSDSISWSYAAEKLVACFGIIFVMTMISQAFIYPVVMQTVAMKEAGLPLRERLRAVPWMMSDIIFPFMMEYLLTWYLIWETILNFLAELTRFADRSFYAAWWNSVTWDEFARDWNRPVHLFLLRHVYHSSISAMKVNRHTATLITFFLSACVHELVMACIFKKIRGYLLFLQMCQLPLVKLSRTKWLRNRQTLGNIIFWFGIFMGPSILCSLYLIL